MSRIDRHQPPPVIEPEPEPDYGFDRLPGVGPFPIARIEPNDGGQSGVWLVVIGKDGYQFRVGDAVKVEGTGVSDINGVNIQVHRILYGDEETKLLHDDTHDVHDQIIRGKGRVTITQKAVT